MTTRTRHRWVKLRVHVYICRQCGCGKVNAQRGGGWVQTYHLPTGESRQLAATPPCEVGPHTARYLARYAEDIARGGMESYA